MASNNGAWSSGNEKSLSEWPALSDVIGSNGSQELASSSSEVNSNPRRNNNRRPRQSRQNSEGNITSTEIESQSTIVGGTKKKKPKRPTWKPVEIETQPYRGSHSRRQFNNANSGPRNVEREILSGNGRGHHRGSNRRGRTDRYISQYQPEEVSRRDQAQVVPAPFSPACYRSNTYPKYIYSSNLPQHTQTVYYSLNDRIRYQVQHYFSEDNLLKDRFLRSHMDKQGFVDIALIATFRRMQIICPDVNLIFEALKDSTELEVSNDFKVRPVVNPLRWVLNENSCVADLNQNIGSGVEQFNSYGAAIDINADICGYNGYMSFNVNSGPLKPVYFNNRVPATCLTNVTGENSSSVSRQSPLNVVNPLSWVLNENSVEYLDVNTRKSIIWPVGEDVADLNQNIGSCAENFNSYGAAVDINAGICRYNNMTSFQMGSNFIPGPYRPVYLNTEMPLADMNSECIYNNPSQSLLNETEVHCEQTGNGNISGHSNNASGLININECDVSNQKANENFDSSVENFNSYGGVAADINGDRGRPGINIANRKDENTSASRQCPLNDIEMVCDNFSSISIGGNCSDISSSINIKECDISGQNANNFNDELGISGALCNTSEDLHTIENTNRYNAMDLMRNSKQNSALDKVHCFETNENCINVSGTIPKVPAASKSISQNKQDTVTATLNHCRENMNVILCNPIDINSNSALNSGHSFETRKLYKSGKNKIGPIPKVSVASKKSISVHNAATVNGDKTDVSRQNSLEFYMTETLKNDNTDNRSLDSRHTCVVDCNSADINQNFDSSVENFNIHPIVQVGKCMNGEFGSKFNPLLLKNPLDNTKMFWDNFTNVSNNCKDASSPINVKESHIPSQNTNNLNDELSVSNAPCNTSVDLHIQAEILNVCSENINNNINNLKDINSNSRFNSALDNAYNFKTRKSHKDCKNGIGAMPKVASKQNITVHNAVTVNSDKTGVSRQNLNHSNNTDSTGSSKLESDAPKCNIDGNVSSDTLVEDMSRISYGADETQLLKHTYVSAYDPSFQHTFPLFIQQELKDTVMLVSDEQDTVMNKETTEKKLKSNKKKLSKKQASKK